MMPAAWLALLMLESQAAGYTISGAVVDSVSSAPLRAVRVSLFESRSRRLLEELTTGDSGGFRFEGLPPGKYTLQAEKPGYVTQRFGQKALYAPFFSGVVTGEGLVSEGLRFALIPSAAITGTVRDETGEPVPGLRVTCFRRTGSPSAPRWVLSGTDTTDDLGQYRIHSLRKGVYLVAAQGAEWQWRESHTRGGQRWGYPPVFSPGVADASKAEMLSLEPGAEQRADIAVRGAPLVSVNGVVPDGRIPAGARAVLLSQFSRSSYLQAGNPVNVGPKGFRFQNVAPGSYTLLIGSPADPRLLDLKQITVGEEPLTVQIGGEPPPGAKVTVQWADAAPSGRVMLALDADGDVASQMAFLDPDSTATFSVVPPGQYVPRLLGANQPYAITGITVKPGRVVGSTIEVTGAGQTEIRLTAVSGVKDLEGRVFRDGQPLAGALVMLVPRDHPLRSASITADQSDSDGSFTWRGVAPGQYLAFALEHGDIYDYGDPEALKPLLRLGQPVTVQPGQNPELRIEATRLE